MKIHRYDVSGHLASHEIDGNYRIEPVDGQPGLVSATHTKLNVGFYPVQHTGFFSKREARAEQIQRLRRRVKRDQAEIKKLREKKS